MHPTPPALRRVRAWTRGALRLEAGHSWEVEPAHEPAVDLVEAVRRHRVAELVGSQADALALPEAVRGPVNALRAVSRRQLMVQILEIERLQTLFRDAGLPTMVIKGPALAAQTSGDPGARGSGDIDLLVDPGHVEEAHRLLVDRGWVRRDAYDVTPGTWAWNHAVRSFNAFTYDGAASSVDLHWRLDPTLEALPTFAEVWDRRVSVDLGGIAVETLCHADLLPHTCLHAAKDSWRWMRSLVDVHRLAADPRTWERSLSADPLRRLEVETLAVTRFVVGLPPTVPAAVLARLDQVGAATLNRALLAQERPVKETYPFPGTESFRLLRYMMAASGTGRDRRHSAVSIALPVKSVVGIEARSGWTGVPLTLWHRVGRLRRRSVAWARREPGAGVVEPLVRSPR